MSVGLLRMAMVRQLDAHARAFPSGFRSWYVDDCGTVQFGSRRHLAQRAATATADMLDRLERTLILPVAQDKLQVVTSGRDLGCQFKVIMARKGYPTFSLHGATELLGGGLRSGKSEVDEGAVQPIPEGQGRTPRIQALRAAGVPVARF